MPILTGIQRTAYQGFPAAIPSENENGRKTFATVFNIDFSLYPIENSGGGVAGVICDVSRSEFSYPIRSIYVDNTSRWNPLYILIPDTGQIISVAGFDEIIKPIISQSTSVIVFDGVDGGAVQGGVNTTVILSSENQSPYSRLSPALARGSVGKNTTPEFFINGEFCHDLLVKPDRLKFASVNISTLNDNATIFALDANYPSITFCGYSASYTAVTGAAAASFTVVLEDSLGVNTYNVWTGFLPISSRIAPTLFDSLGGLQVPIRVDFNAVRIRVSATSNITNGLFNLNVSYAQTKRSP